MRVVIVGSSVAGVRTALPLRGAGCSGRLTLAGAERHLPYDEPPLSEQFLVLAAGLAPADLAA